MLAILVAAIAVATEDVLAGDERLDKPLSLRFEVVAARDVLSEIGKHTETKLQIEPTLAEDLVILFTQDRPAREVMARIADHFDWAWKRSDDGYTLYRTDEHRRREEKSFEEELIAGLKTAQTKLQKSLAQLESLSEEQLKERIRALDHVLKDHNAAGRHSEAWSIEREIWALRTPLIPTRNLSARAFIGLDSAALRELAQRESIVISSEPTPLQHPLPASARHYLEPAVDSQKDKPVRKARITFRTSRDLGVKRYVTGFVHWLGEEGQVLGMSSTGNIDYDLVEPDLGKRELPPVFDKQIPLTLALRYAVRAADESDPKVLAQVRALHRTADNDWEPLRPGAVALIEVAEFTGHDLIAHASDTPMVLEERAAVSRPTPSALLRVLTSPWQRWEVRDRWIEVRDYQRALSRFRTVPRSVFYPARREYHRNAGLDLDRVTEIATKLNDLQLRTRAGWYSTGDGAIQRYGMADAYLARLWASLNPIAKRNVASGRPISLENLSPHQRQLCIEVLLREKPILPGPTGFFDWLGPEFASVARGVVTLNPDEPDSEPTEYLHLAAPQDVSITIRLAEVPTIGMLSNGSTTLFHARGAKEALSQYFDREGALFRPVTEQIMICRIDVLQARGGTFIFARSGLPGHEWVPADRLPKGLIDRIRTWSPSDGSER